MKHPRNYILLAGAQLLLGLGSALAQSISDYAVCVSATVQTNPAQVALSWPADPQATSYTVYRKTRDASSWGAGTALATNATSYVDGNVAVSNSYEYRISKTASAGGASFVGEGYIYTGIQAPLVESRGKVILLVDSTFSSSLATELGRLQQDLVGDGWTVLRHDVARTSAPPTIKALITTDYNADPTNVNAVFLFGHVPVPYSGNIVPDGHILGHQGAWPCDGYYGDMNGVWTDNSVNITGADDPRNMNVPGDGKFDQSTFPAALKLMVGRVDLANMPGELWSGGPTNKPSEVELLRNYLNKDHAFRTKQFDLPRRGAVGDFFGVHGGEAFAASGWRNFAPFFGANNITNIQAGGAWTPTLASTPYLWAYGCGSGSFTSIAGLGNGAAGNALLTTELYTNDVKAVFTFLFGSWLGDWDSQDNIMRCVLALPSYGLTCAWAGRPHWFLHHMALGEPIGFGTRLTQNNGPAGLYHNQINSAAGQVHVALMGDPTLRLHVVAPPAGLIVTTNTSGGVNLRWNASPDTVAGYHVYRATSIAGPLTRLTSALLSATNYTDTLVSSNTYVVRAVKLEVGSSGSYYNASEGVFQSLASMAAGAMVHLGLTALGSGSFLITGSGMPGRSYQIQAHDGLNSSTWQTLGTVTADSSGAIRFIDTPASPQRMYRTASQ